MQKNPTITKFEQVCRDAQRTANRDNCAVVILNLNRVGQPLYVIRAWNDQKSDAIVGRFSARRPVTRAVGPCQAGRNRTMDIPTLAEKLSLVAFGALSVAVFAFIIVSLAYACYLAGH